MNRSRRRFLRTSCAAITATAFASSFERFGLVSAFANPIAGAAVSDYKALVCIFLAGGNDGNNTVVPKDASGYQQYSSTRGTLAIPQTQLLSIQPTSISTLFGLHPSLTDLQQLFIQQKLAVVANVGTLAAPLTRTTYRNGSVPKPYQLFSHSDQTQQYHTSRADTGVQTGWGGLLSDRTAAMNGATNFPMVTSVGGTVVFSQGIDTRPLGIGPAPTPLTQVLVLNGYNTSAPAVSRRASLDYLRTVDRSPLLVRSSQDAVQQALDVSLAFSSDPVLSTVFPDTNIGNQLKQVAKVIKLNQSEPRLGLRRQIFFCQVGGYDTHQNQPSSQSTLLTNLSAAMKAFYDATVELALESKVTTFTMSDFSRTLQPSGGGASIGTDHGWGNHLFVMGGAVKGGDFYGVVGPNGTVYPTLQLNGPDDAETRGRWIPTSAVEQYAGTLAKWYGLAAADFPLVFPLIGRFTTNDLGFML